MSIRLRRQFAVDRDRAADQQLLHHGEREEEEEEGGREIAFRQLYVSFFFRSLGPLSPNAEAGAATGAC